MSTPEKSTHDEIDARSQRHLGRGAAPLTDFEDAALASAAEAAGCELIITRNVADFGSSPVPAVTPEEFLLAG